MRNKILDTFELYTGKIFSLKQDKIEYENGRVARFDYIAHGGAVCVLPVDTEDNIYYIEQYRPAIRQSIIELPAGTLEVGEDPEECALRELKEEIGMGTDSMRLIGQLFLAPGYSNELMHIFLAKGLYPEMLPGDIDEVIQVKKCPLKAFKKKIAEGEIIDAKTIAVMAIADPYLDPSNA